MSQRKPLPPPLPVEVRARALALHANGVPSVEIADRVGVKATTIRSWIRRQRKKDHPPAQPIVPSVVEIAAPDEYAEIPEDLPEQARVYEENMREAAVKFSHHVKNLPAEQIAAKADRIKSLDVVNRRALKIETEKPATVIQLGVLCQPVRKVKDDGRLRSVHRSAKLLEAQSEPAVSA